MRELDGIWNCQIVENGLKYLNESKIVHYFSSRTSSNKQSAYLFYNEDVYKLVREKGIMCDELQQLLKKPRAAFGEDCKVITGEDSQYLLSIANVMYKSHPFIFKVFEQFSYSYLRLLRCADMIRKGSFLDKVKSKYF